MIRECFICEREFDDDVESWIDWGEPVEEIVVCLNCDWKIDKIIKCYDSCV